MGLMEHHGMPKPEHELGYRENEVKDILWIQFLRFMRGQTVALVDGSARYYPLDVHNFLHEGKMFWD